MGVAKEVIDNSDTILFIVNAKNRKDKRKVEKEYNRTIDLYRNVEKKFGEELFLEADGSFIAGRYQEIYDKYVDIWDKLCVRNNRLKRHQYTVPNRYYFLNKYAPKEIPTNKSWASVIKRKITKMTSKINFIEG